MMARDFKAFHALWPTLAAATFYGLYQTAPAEWILAFAVIAGFWGAVQTGGWLWETLIILVEKSRDADYRLKLAAMIARMTTPQLELFERLTVVHFVGAGQAQPEAMPGFSLVTQEFAADFFSRCMMTPGLVPVREYPEGRADRAREQAQELTAWLIKERYATGFAGGSRPAQWAYDGAAREAAAKLGFNAA